MIKAIALMSRLQSVTRPAFEAHFEKTHAPLVLSLLPGIRRYRRNYVRSAAIGGAGVGEEAPFDALVELTFDDEAGLDGFLDTAKSSEVRRALAADKANFMDAPRSRFFRVREAVLDIAKSPGEADPKVKLALFLRRRAHVTRDQFAAYYDTTHAPLLSRLLPWIRVYNRNHILGSAIGVQGVGSDPPFDTFTELKFKDNDAVTAFRAEFAKPEIMKQIRDDEANFLQGEFSRLFQVEEFDSVIA